MLFPLLLPAILTSFSIVFADPSTTSSSSATCRSALHRDDPIRIYSTARGAPTPALNALASVMLFSTLIAVGIAYVLYRVLTRGERSAREPGGAFKDFAAQI